MLWSLHSSFTIPSVVIRFYHLLQHSLAGNQYLQYQYLHFNQYLLVFNIINNLVRSHLYYWTISFCDLQGFLLWSNCLKHITTQTFNLGINDKKVNFYLTKDVIDLVSSSHFTFNKSSEVWLWYLPPALNFRIFLPLSLFFSPMRFWLYCSLPAVSAPRST